jgi:hypothetical protein
MTSGQLAKDFAGQAHDPNLIDSKGVFGEQCHCSGRMHVQNCSYAQVRNATRNEAFLNCHDLCKIFRDCLLTGCHGLDPVNQTPWGLYPNLSCGRPDHHSTTAPCHAAFNEPCNIRCAVSRCFFKGASAKTVGKAVQTRRPQIVSATLCSKNLCLTSVNDGN